MRAREPAGASTASDPLVLAAGGTSLALSPAIGAYSGELAWNTSAGQ